MPKCLGKGQTPLRWLGAVAPLIRGLQGRRRSIRYVLVAENKVIAGVGRVIADF